MNNTVKEDNCIRLSDYSVDRITSLKYISDVKLFFALSVLSGSNEGLILDKDKMLKLQEITGVPVTSLRFSLKRLRAANMIFKVAPYTYVINNKIASK